MIRDASILLLRTVKPALCSLVVPFAHFWSRLVPNHSKPSRPTPRKPRMQDTVRLSADGLAKVLGDLETRVLQAVWHLGRPAPARAVHARVARKHRVEPLTVITVLNKLVAKGLLTREKREDLFHYEARFTEEEFLAHTSRRVVEGILSLGPEAVATSLVDVLAERDPEQLAELGRLIRRRLKEQGG
jgi:predicted transcriptional regulator